MKVSKTRGHKPPSKQSRFGRNPNLEVGAGRCAPPGLLPHPGTKPGNHGKGNLLFSCFALNPFLSQSLGQLLGSPHPGPHPHRPEAPSQGHRSRDQLWPLPARPPPSWSRWSFALTLEHSGTCLPLHTPWSRALPARLMNRFPEPQPGGPDSSPAPTALLPRWRWRWPHRWPMAAVPGPCDQPSPSTQSHLLRGAERDPPKWRRKERRMEEPQAGRRRCSVKTMNEQRPCAGLLPVAAPPLGGASGGPALLSLRRC